MWGGGALPGGLSADGYLDKRLRPLDAEHYSAAGLLPYRKREDSIELLLPKERPWNSFQQSYDPLAWNIFGGKRVPRQERSAETTGVRCFLESVGQVEGVPDTEELYTWISSSFSLWYPMGKMAVMVMEVPEDKMADFPERYKAWKSEAGNQEEFRILPMGIKKYNKQIDEVVWVGVADLIPEMKEEASDLLKNLLEVGNFKEFLLGNLDLEKQFGPDTERPPPEPAQSKGKGKSNGKGYSKGGSKGGKGYGGGSKGYSGDFGYGMDFSFGGGKGGKYGGGKFGGKDNSYMGGMAKGMQMPMPMPMPQQMMMAPPMQPPMAPPMPAGQPAEVQRQMYGEQLYLLVQPLSPSPYLAQKITGMLLELPQNELLLNLTNMDELSRRVSEALEVLREDGIVS